MTKNRSVIGETITQAQLLESQLEAPFMEQIIDLAERVGWLIYHTHDSRGSNRGFLDLVMVRRGRVVFAEIKRQKARLDRDQEIWFAALSAAGMEVHVWRPSDWESIISTLT